MKRLKITFEQYHRLLINESSNSKGTFNYPNGILMSLAKLIGVKLKNFNLDVAENDLKKEETYKKIKEILNDEVKIKNIIEDLNNKGLIDSDKKILYKSDDFVNNFNKYAKKYGFNYNLTHSEIINKIMKNK